MVFLKKVHMKHGANNIKKENDNNTKQTFFKINVSSPNGVITEDIAKEAGRQFVRAYEKFYNAAQNVDKRFLLTRLYALFVLSKHYYVDEVLVKNELIEKLLLDKNPAVKYLATIGLSKLERIRPTSLLKYWCNNRDVEKRRLAVRILTLVGTGRAPSMVADMLEDPNTEVRKEAIRGLAYMGCYPAADHIRELAEEDPDEDVQLEAERALEKLELSNPWITHMY